MVLIAYMDNKGVISLAWVQSVPRMFVHKHVKSNLKT